MDRQADPHRRCRPSGDQTRCPLCDHDARSDTGEPDLDTLRTIISYRGLREGKNADFGVLADVEEPGRVRLGDEVRPARLAREPALQLPDRDDPRATSGDSQQRRHAHGRSDTDRMTSPTASPVRLDTSGFRPNRRRRRWRSTAPPRPVRRRRARCRRQRRRHGSRSPRGRVRHRASAKAGTAARRSQGDDQQAGRPSIRSDDRGDRRHDRHSRTAASSAPRRAVRIAARRRPVGSGRQFGDHGFAGPMARKCTLRAPADRRRCFIAPLFSPPDRTVAWSRPVRCAA